MGAGVGGSGQTQGLTWSPALQPPSPDQGVLNFEQVRLWRWAARHSLARQLQLGCFADL